ncbi:MAG: DNA recombination protein RmuC [Bdellovibrionales bacterium]
MIGLALGGSVVWLVLRARFASEAGLGNTFEALAAKTLRDNAESFLQLAETRLKQSEQAAAAVLDKKAVAIDEMVKPVKESLQKMDAQLQALEVKREGAYRELLAVVEASRETHMQLRSETSQLLQALRAPASRGRWGEMQLKRILEMTGMSAHAKDFTLQHSLADGQLRPDAIVNLPGNRCIVIDSKVPLAAFMDATQTPDETLRQTALKQHARHLREHVRLLGAKAYWEQIEGTPEFVVLFLPGDHFLSAALDCDGELMDYSVLQKVVLATPMTLIALLRTVAYGWRQENLRENARKVGALGGELYGALVTMTEHLGNLGSRLGASLNAYNQAIGSFDRNVLGKARRLREYGAGKDGKSLPEGLDPIDIQPRAITAVAERNEDVA